MNATVAHDEIDTLADRLAETAAILDATTHRFLTDLRAFDELEGWAKQGAVSCAHWLSWRCGLDLGAAREKVRVARALSRLPLLDKALADGKVSFSKVRAITRVADADSEAKLVEMATSTTASQLEMICKLYRQTQAGDPAVEAEKRWLKSYDGDDGMVRIVVSLRPEEAEHVLKACDASADTRLEGLLAMADGVLRGDHPDRPPTEVVVHVDAATLAGHAGDAGVSAETSRRLLCDAGIVPMLEDAAGTPLDVGRKTRVFSTAMRRALVTRDGGCRFPGCTHRRYVDGHHIQHWVADGETSMENCLLLCTRHHKLVHEGGFQVRRVGDEVRFFSPGGVDLSTMPVTSSLPPIPRRHAPPPVWNGEPIDDDEAVASLCS
jgi:uncharacterized protein DUF222